MLKYRVSNHRFRFNQRSCANVWSRKLAKRSHAVCYTALAQPKAWNWTSGDSATRAFDTDGRMLSTELASYGYDAASRITSITQNLWASLVTTDPVTGVATTSTFTTPMTWAAAYDNRNRLTSFTRGGNSASTVYSYDANSNRLTAVTKTTSDTDLDGDFDEADYSKTASQSLNVDVASSKLLGFTQTLVGTKGTRTVSSTTTQINYGLDAAGNLTSDGLRLFEYDASNRLAKVLVSQSAEASKITYLHNALGQRVFKSEPTVAYTAPDEAVLGTDFITWLKKNFGWLFAQAQVNATLGQGYVYDEANLGSTPNLLGEYGNGGTRSAGRIEYIWLPTEDGQSIPIGIYKGGRFYAVHADHINTPRLITDDTNKPVWQWPYSAFGENKPTGILKATPNPRAAITNQPQLLKATAAALEVNLRYPGQYFDEESNLSYNGFRSYQPAQGRYSQSDPIGLAGGWNTYAYVGGNPLGFTDPMGLQAQTLPVIVPIVIVGCALTPGCRDAVKNWAESRSSGTGVPEQSWPSYPPYNPTDTSGADKEARDKCSATYDAQIKVCQLTSATPTARQACYARAANEYGDCLKKNCR
ncbi:MAG: RHS repeat-associated core domain-containing protein [Rhodoferax sp.]|nr:RHS repeat-associated core domain-containing protein [Rhodoferax sp.]